MTSRGWSVSSAAQSRKLERNPCGTARDAAPFEQQAQLLEIQPPAAPAGEHERAVAERPGDGKDRQRAPAQRHPVLPLHLHPRGRDGPHVFRRVHLVPRASRTRPDRAAVSTRNSNASMTAGFAPDARTVASAAATSRCGNARMCCTMLRWGRAPARPGPMVCRCAGSSRWPTPARCGSAA